MMTFVHTEKGKKMSRYINANALKKRIDKEIFRHDTIDHVFQIIDDAPSIDICFCKECVKHKTHRCHMAFDLIATEDDDFCSYGERNDSEKPNNSKVSEIPTGSERSSE